MNNRAAFLTHPHPCGHIVYPYADEKVVTEAMCLYARSGLQNGEAVILVMSNAHRKVITIALQTHGFDLAELTKIGKLSCLAAEELLPAFMLYGMPDAGLFEQVAGQLIRYAKKRGQEGRVRVFGEMVSLLWEENLAAAIRLEQLWNEMIENEKISLLCTYTLRKKPFNVIPPSIASLHSHYLAAS